MDKRADSGLVADIEKSYPLRPVKLMPAGRKQVNMTVPDIDRQMPIHLHRIGMEQNTLLCSNLTDLPDRLDRSDLIIGIHHGNQYSIRTNRPFQLLYINNPVAVHIQIRNFRPLLFQIFTGMQHRMMLYLRCDNVLPLIAVCLIHPFNRPVIRLRTASGEKNLIPFGSQGSGNRLPCLYNRLLTLTSQPVDTAGVPIVFREVRQHSLHHFRCSLCGSRMIQINHIVYPSLPRLS